MVRTAITVAFLCIFFGGLFVYFSKEENSIQQRLDKDLAKKPRIVMEEMQLRRMQGAVTMSQMSADRAMFFEPNEIQLEGHVVGSRIREEGEELVRSDQARILLASKTIKETMGDLKVESADLSGNVAMIAKQHQFRTQRAHYDAATEIATSDVPVAIVGLLREINGAGGFKYLLRTEELEVKGPVSGYIYPKERQP